MTSLFQILQQSSVLPDAINLGLPSHGTRTPITPDQIRHFAQKLPTSTHVTLLNLSFQSIGPDLLLELVGQLALLTSLRELHLAGVCADIYLHMRLATSYLLVIHSMSFAI